MKEGQARIDRCKDGSTYLTARRQKIVTPSFCACRNSFIFLIRTDQYFKHNTTAYLEPLKNIKYGETKSQRSRGYCPTS